MYAYQRDVLAFHKRFGSHIGNVREPRVYNGVFRAGFIREESREFQTALLADDAVEMADGLCDLLYVTIGSGIEFGIDMTVRVPRFDDAKPDPGMALIDRREEWIERFQFATRRCSEEIARGDVHACAAVLAAMVELIKAAVKAWGINLRPLWKEVHRSNMEKVPSGSINVKTIKPPGWKRPNLRPILIEQYERAFALAMAQA
jgi:predicted HAD superfamily Cof-like phosphohydrolase